MFPQPTASLPPPPDDDNPPPNPLAFFAPRLTLCATGFSLSQYTFNPSFLPLLLFVFDLLLLLVPFEVGGVEDVLDDDEDDDDGPESCSFISFA